MTLLLDNSDAIVVDGIVRCYCQFGHDVVVVDCSDRRQLEGATIGRFRRTLFLSWLTVVWMTGSIKIGVSILIEFPW